MRRRLPDERDESDDLDDLDGLDGLARAVSDLLADLADAEGTTPDAHDDETA